jgi:hypothetical protein
MTKPTLQAVDSTSSIQTATSDPTAVFDDLASLRKQSKLTVQRKPVLINVTVDKPANNVHFRAHGDPAWQLDDTTILRDTAGTARDFYFVHPNMRDHPKLVQRVRWVTIALLSIWPGGNIQLWPVPLLNVKKPPKAWKSARVAFELAQTKWTSIVWNEQTTDYDVETAENIDKEPVWPDKSMSELLKIGFADKIIDNEDHPCVRQLRGLVDE